MSNSQSKLKERFVRPDMDPHKLQHFLAVYQHGNFRRAAESVSVTQQAVSKAISRLEDQLGLQLFERSTYGAQPTVFAHALARHAKIILSEINLASAELMSMRGSTEGFLQVGLGWSQAQNIGPQAIKQFREQRPGVGLRVLSGPTLKLHTLLLQGELDLTISAPPKELSIDKALEVQPLYVEQDSIVMRKQHPLADKESITLEDISYFPWLMALSSPERWHSICEIFVQQGLAPPREVVDVDSMTLVRSMLVKEDYITLLGEGMLELETHHNLCCEFKLDNFHLNRTAILATRKGAGMQPAAQVFKSILIKLCGQR